MLVSISLSGSEKALLELNDSSTYRLGSSVGERPSKVREVPVRSPVWPYLFSSYRYIISLLHCLAATLTGKRPLGIPICGVETKVLGGLEMHRGRP